MLHRHTNNTKSIMLINYELKTVNIMDRIDDYAIRYECILKKAYSSDRYKNANVNADDYRHLLEAYWELMESTNQDFEERKNKFTTQCKQISNNLLNASEKLKIEKTEPQNTIHGINILIDHILKETREDNDNN